MLKMMLFFLISFLFYISPACAKTDWTFNIGLSPDITLLKFREESPEDSKFPVSYSSETRRKKRVEYIYEPIYLGALNFDARSKAWGTYSLVYRDNKFLFPLSQNNSKVTSQQFGGLDSKTSYLLDVVLSYANFVIDFRKFNFSAGQVAVYDISGDPSSQNEGVLIGKEHFEASLDEVTISYKYLDLKEPVFSDIFFGELIISRFKLPKIPYIYRSNGTSWVYEGEGTPQIIDHELIMLGVRTKNFSHVNIKESGILWNLAFDVGRTSMIGKDQDNSTFDYATTCFRFDMGLGYFYNFKNFLGKLSSSIIFNRESYNLNLDTKEPSDGEGKKIILTSGMEEIYNLSFNITQSF